MYSTDMTHSKSLPDFYEELRTKQEKDGGSDYCAVHDGITKLLGHCKSYKEFGVNQGTTASAAIMMHPESVELIDIKLSSFDPCRHLFEKYCKKHNIKLTIKELSSIDKKSVSTSDILLIDTCHYPIHLAKELILHEKYIAKYIVLHDTVLYGGVLHKVAEQFVQSNRAWEILEYFQKNVGYTIIKRKVF